MADLSERGLRNPEHTFALRTGERELHPFMAAPLRPMETLIGIRLQAHAMFQRMVKIPWFIPIDVEVGIWKVPLSTIGDYFVDLIVADAEDSDVFPSRAGSGVVSPVTGDLPSQTGQGPDTRGMQRRNRQWAGEIGYGDLNVAGDTRGDYMPYVSASVWHVARMYYEMEIDQTPFGSGERNDDDLWQLPPRLGNGPRGATFSSIGVGSKADSDGSTETGFETSISAWAERISLMDRPNRTYAEYLEAQGVNPRRVASLPEPIMLQRQGLTPQGDAQGWFEQTPGSNAFFSEGPMGQLERQSVGTDKDLVGDEAGVALMDTRFDVTRGRRIMVDEPSILLGTVAWYPQMVKGNEFAHMLDITRMVNGAHWGDASFGGVEERDFLTAQDLRNQEGTNPQQNIDGEDSPFAFNMLNLYLNGDSFCNDVEAFDWYGVGQGAPTDEFALLPGSQQVNFIGNTRFGIATDMVS